MSVDQTDVRFRLIEWPRCEFPSDAHNDVLAGRLTKSQGYTLTMLRVWGRKDGRVFRNRAALAKELKFRCKKPLLAHIAALVKTGWIDRVYEPPNAHHVYPLYVLILRAERRPAEECSCQEWHGCTCGKGRFVPPGVNGVGRVPLQRGTPLQRDPGVPLQRDPMKKKEIEVEGFREASSVGRQQRVEPGMKGEGGSVKAERGTETETKERNGTKPEETLRNETHAAPSVVPWQPGDPPLEEKDAEAHEATEEGGEARRRSGGKKGNGKSKAPPKALSEKFGDPVWPPRTDYRAGYDVACKWIAEMRERHPDYALDDPGPKEAGQARLLFEQIHDPDKLLAVIRIAVWDWLAIQETIESWYTKGKPAPDPTHILKILPHLANRIGRGVISPGRRVSDYKRRWIDGTWRDPRAPKKGGMSRAEKARAGMLKKSVG